MTKYRAEINQRQYPLNAEQLDRLDLVPTGDGSYHLLHEGTSYRVGVARIDRNGKTVVLRLNDREYTVRLRDETDQLVEQLGLATVEVNTSKDTYAPMPGLVLKTLVAPGDTVTAGTPLLILEAMKMENVLKADGDGTVTQLAVSQGEAVEKGQLLIEIE